MVFHITPDLYLGKWITLAYLLYFQTVDYFAFLTRKPDLSLRKFFISTCHVSIKTAIFSELILIGLFVLILSFYNNHYQQSVTIGRRNVHFLLEIKQHWKTELIKTVNYFIKKNPNIVVYVCAIESFNLCCYVKLIHTTHKIIKTFPLCSIQRKINFYGKVLNLALLTSRCIFLPGFDLDTLKKKEKTHLFSYWQFQSNHYTLYMILYSTVGQVIAVTKPYDCIDNSL